MLKTYFCSNSKLALVLPFLGYLVATQISSKIDILSLYEVIMAKMLADSTSSRYMCLCPSCECKSFGFVSTSSWGNIWLLSCTNLDYVLQVAANCVSAVWCCAGSILWVSRNMSCWKCLLRLENRLRKMVRLNQTVKLRPVNHWAERC